MPLVATVNVDSPCLTDLGIELTINTYHRVLMMLVHDSHTPVLRAADPRGLAVRWVAYCCVEGSSIAETRINRVEFDAVGRARAQWDPRLWALRSYDAATPGNLENMFSLSGLLLNSLSVDAGQRVNLLGELGQILHSWDGRGIQQQLEYDCLQRPAALFEKALNGSAACVARYLYGAADESSTVHNCYGQVIRRDGPEGICQFKEFSIKGELLEQCQRFLHAFEPLHWPQALSDRDDLLELGEGATTCMSLNALGQVVTQTDAQGNEQQFDHTVDGQLGQSRLRLKGDGLQVLVQDIHYNAQGDVERETAGNGVVSAFDYALRNGRLIRLRAWVPQQQALQDLNYVYDPVGNILSVEDKVATVRFFANQRIEPITHYAYDSLYQLVSASGWEAGGANQGPEQITDPQAVATYHQTYGYDAGGNLLRLVHKGPQSHGRLLVAGQYSNRCLPENNGLASTQADIAVGFDGCGNLRSLENGRVLSWNLRNQLSDVRPVVRESGIDDSEHYIYDIDGLRLRKIRSAQTNARTVISETRYLPGLEVRTNTANGETLYVISAQAGRNSVQVLQWKDAPPQGVASQQYRYTLGDHLGSCTLELDSQARVIRRETYHPFGTTAFSEKGDSSESSYRTLWYSGKELDATGLYYYGLRYYMPWLQRWINPDPKGYMDGSNIYAFVGNNPVSFVDTDGAVRIDVSHLTEEQKKATDIEGAQAVVAWEVYAAGQGDVKPSTMERELSSELFKSFKQAHVTNLVTKTLLIEGSPNQYVDFWRSPHDPEAFLAQRDIDHGVKGFVESRTGNCGEHAILAFNLLASTETQQPVFHVKAQGMDHAFTVIGDRRELGDKRVVVVDPWPTFPMVHTADVGEFKIGDILKESGMEAIPNFQVDDATLAGNSKRVFPLIVAGTDESKRRKNLIKKLDSRLKAHADGKTSFYMHLFSISDQHRGMSYTRPGRSTMFNTLPASYVTGRVEHYSSFMDTRYGPNRG